MKQNLKLFSRFLIIILVLSPMHCLAAEAGPSLVLLGARLLSYSNFILVVTSLLCMKHLFFPGENNRVVFHGFHIFFIILFYGLSLPFLIHNKDLYDGFATLSNSECVRKYFFSKDISSVMQWVIVLTFFINIIYIIKYRKNYIYND